ACALDRLVRQTRLSRRVRRIGRPPRGGEKEDAPVAIPAEARRSGRRRLIRSARTAAHSAALEDTAIRSLIRPLVMTAGLACGVAVACGRPYSTENDY